MTIRNQLEKFRNGLTNFDWSVLFTLIGSAAFVVVLLALGGISAVLDALNIASTGATLFLDIFAAASLALIVMSHSVSGASYLARAFDYLFSGGTLFKHEPQESKWFKDFIKARPYEYIATTFGVLVGLGVGIALVILLGTVQFAIPLHAIGVAAAAFVLTTVGIFAGLCARLGRIADRIAGKPKPTDPAGAFYKTWRNYELSLVFAMLTGIGFLAAVVSTMGIGVFALSFSVGGMLVPFWFIAIATLSSLLSSASYIGRALDFLQTDTLESSAFLVEKTASDLIKHSFNRLMCAAMHTFFGWKLTPENSVVDEEQRARCIAIADRRKFERRMTFAGVLIGIGLGVGLAVAAIAGSVPFLSALGPIAIVFFAVSHIGTCGSIFNRIGQAIDNSLAVPEIKSEATSPKSSYHLVSDKMVDDNIVEPNSKPAQVKENSAQQESVVQQAARNAVDWLKAASRSSPVFSQLFSSLTTEPNAIVVEQSLSKAPGK
jgi:hypothetical protein